MRSCQLYMFLSCLLLASTSWTQQIKMTDYMETFVEREVFKHATISATVLEVNGKAELLGYRKDKALVPASSLKLLTSYSALQFLGENYTYQTDLSYAGNILADGTLEGNVYITGSGDPTLGSSKFKAYLNFPDLMADMVAGIRAAGINCISQNIIADESVFNSYPISPSWQWNDLGNYYAGGAWGLNINDNQYYVYFGQQPTKGMIPKLLRYGPKIPNLTFQNEVETGDPGSGDNAYIFGGPYDYTKRIVGTIPPGAKEFTIKGSIPDPPLFLAYHVQSALKKKNIKVDGYESLFEWDTKKPTLNLIKSYRSPPLSDIVKSTNFDSNNLYCEALLKTIGLEETGKGSGSGGIKVITEYLESLSLDVEGLRMDDGSGLSARNLISTSLMAEFLKEQAKAKDLKWATSFLPRVGSQGTVRHMLKNSPAKDRVWAKSGSMEGILSYSGYVKAKSGKWLSFCVIVNGFPQKIRTIRKHLEDFIESVYLLN